MPTFKDDSILIIAPGSQTTLAQLGLPESFTPARFRFKSRMFPAEKRGEWEPHKVREKRSNGVNGSVNGVAAGQKSGDEDGEGPSYEEDLESDDGAVWPIKQGRITNWSCFFALMDHVYHKLNTLFHHAILLIAQPCWTPREHEKITQFFFERFKTPAFALMDSAQATCYAFGVESACVIDVGAEKADITAIAEFQTDHIGRSVAVPDCGGEAMTARLHALLSSKGFNREMCEQLKRSPICEILPPGTPLPGPQNQDADTSNPAALASTGADGPGAGQRNTAGSVGAVPRGPGENTEVGDDLKDDEDNEGVIDVASIVTGGRMNEYLAKKEREKAEKQASKKGGGGPAAPPPKPIRLKNAERERNTFSYEDYALFEELKNSSAEKSGVAGVATAAHETATTANEASTGISATSEPVSSIPKTITQPPRREISVGTERFQAASGQFLTNLAAATHRTIQAYPTTKHRAELWNHLILVGNGARVRGLTEALLALLNSRYLISPSTATIFTSELPSNFSTPLATGANTPIPSQSHSHAGHGVNPLLLAATRASAQQQQQQQQHLHQHPQQHTPQHPHMSSSGHLLPGGHQATPTQTSHYSHGGGGHGQTPTSIKFAKLPEYFPEWKDIGSDEAAFLGAQVAAKVVFVVDQDQRGSKGFMTRSEYNESGPTGIHDFSM